MPDADVPPLVLTNPPKPASDFKPRSPKEREILARIIELNNAYRDVAKRLRLVGRPIDATAFCVATAAYVACHLRLMMELPGFVPDIETIDQLLGWRRLAESNWETSGEYWFRFHQSRGSAHRR